MSKYKYEKEFMFSNRRWEEIELFLQSEELPLDLTSIRDAHKNTVLHHTAYHNQPKVMEIYLKYYRKQLENNNRTLSEIRQMTREFLDSDNHEGYTAAHYAAYRGNVAVLKIIEKYDGNVKLTNYLKMGALHLAAQGDKVASFLYFHPLGLDINLKDAKMSTPLHWAAFSGSEQIVQYLMARGAEVNLQDLEGLTPLHLATTYGNTRIVKMLLLAGADRTIRNNSGKIPIELAREREFQKIQRMLDDQYCFTDRVKIVCNAKTKYQPTSKSLYFPLAFVLIALLIGGLVFGMVEFTQIWPLAVQGGLLGVSLFLFFWLTFSRSPALPVDKNYQMYAQSGRLHRLCMFCVKYMNPREHHCPICKACIPQYDHHCTWINNCVGRHNVARFMVFLVVLEATLLWLGFVGGSMAGCLGGKSGLITLKEWTEGNEWTVYMGCIVLLGLAAGFGLPLSVLITVQGKNLLLGRTTYERFSKNNQSILTRESALMEGHLDLPPKMKLKHCWWMCYGSEGGKGDHCSSTTTSFVGEV